MVASSLWLWHVLLVLPFISIIKAHGDETELSNKNYWGTYRAYPYLGLRCRSPVSPLMGWMWYQPNQTASLDSILRHESNRDDHLAKFGWNQHDGESYGRQEILDPQNHVRLLIQWAQLDGNSSRWVLRVQGETYQNTEKTNENEDATDLSLLWYVATPENQTVTYNASSDYIYGTQPDYKPYYVWIDQPGGNVHPTYVDSQTNLTTTYNSTYFAALTVNPSLYYNPKPMVVQELRNPTSRLPPHLFDPSALYRAATPRTGNQIVQQVFLKTPFGIDFHFAYDDALDKGSISWEEVTKALSMLKRDFEQKFQDTFVKKKKIELESNPEVTTADALLPSSREDTWSNAQLRTAEYALGNMVGSITYMYGDRQIYDVENDRIISESPTAMTVIVPDRSDHAQGYLWDDGFQEQLVRHWNRERSLEIAFSWWNQTNSEGWIPRQQILGEEVRWSARPSSWPQAAGTANPPSHHLLLEGFLNDCDGTASLDDFFERIWDSFKRNVEWYLRTQTSTMSGLFRWSGRTETYCLPSGMDDYPRAPILTEEEAHLDLHVWMIVSTRTIAKVAKRLGKTEEHEHYERKSQDLTHLLVTKFWDEDRQLFDEFYFDQGKKIIDGHFGYLNFFPIFLMAIPSESKEFEATMEKLLDRNNGIWTKFGLRSLSWSTFLIIKGSLFSTGRQLLDWSNMVEYQLFGRGLSLSLFKSSREISHEIHVAIQNTLRVHGASCRFG